MMKGIYIMIILSIVSSSLIAQENQVVEMSKLDEGDEKRLKVAGLGSGLIGCYWYNPQSPHAGPKLNGISIIDENTGIQQNFDIKNAVDGTQLLNKKFVGISFIPIHSFIYFDINNQQQGMNCDLVGNIINLNNNKKQLIFINSQTKKFLFGSKLWTSSANKIEYDFIHEELIADQYINNSVMNGSVVAVNIYDGSSYFANEYLMNYTSPDWNKSPSKGFNINDNTTCSFNPAQPLINVMYHWNPNHYTSNSFATDGRDIDPSWYGNNYLGGFNTTISIPLNQQDQIDIADTRRSFEDNDEDVCGGINDIRYFISFGERQEDLDIGQPKFYIGFNSNNPSQTLISNVERFLEDMTHRK